MDKKCARSVVPPSVDPPGTKCKLHRPFAFSSPRPRFEQVEGYLTVAEPFLTLPRPLVPTRRIACKPPLMHYGWRVPRDLLLDYARQHRLTRKWGRVLEECEYMERAMIDINKKSGAGIPSDLLKLQPTSLGSPEDFSLVVTLYSNYQLKRRDLPSEEQFNVLRQGLGIEGPPRWYLDDEDWVWSRW
ncbi:uncharacterized protein C8Q71DRAFT_439010 [Rhodofomes roseus]|uniref:Uncharacterized protein n=1 Tax=Rhodofomes roseus TaxID=34475 RepID=A0ABQ8KRT1_9APHY|nr:uncharacterized protein C8Q71DRAFT_439010 [Rhodofomes roseus]KAH9841097.1 hypothetical protein C8Q71DRAFT_439010 [Rhodofomes roseus]